MVSAETPPLVSCLMVTADRPRLMRRALRCYQRQTYPNRELVVVDDGETDLAPVLGELPSAEVTYVKRDPDTDHVLGDLRNVALNAAEGTYLTQWDDDDWYHEDRLKRQAEVLDDGADACALHGTLMHLDAEEYFYHPYIGLLEEGVPGTIMHRRNESIRYPGMRRAEDSAFLRAWREHRFERLPRDDAYLFIRCFHGTNTWERKHFLTRMRNTPRDFLLYGYYRFVRGDLREHPRFQLSDTAWKAFQQYMRDSIDLNLFDTPADPERIASLA